MIVFALRTDLLNGFSDEEMCYGEGEDGEEEKTGLDLFAAMLDSGASEKQEKTKTASRKRSVVRERHGSENSKRRKLAENTKKESSETAESANEELNIMRGTGVSKLRTKKICAEILAQLLT